MSGCLAGCFKFLARRRLGDEPGEWVDYSGRRLGDVHRLRFSANPGTALERAWNSTTHAEYLEQWHTHSPMDMLFVSVPVWQLHTNIPSRTIRLVRRADNIQELYTQDQLAGTWRMINPTIMEFLYTSNGWTRYYENVPGSTAWIRRSDTDDEGWSVFLAPLIVQYPGEMMPPGQAGIQVPIATVQDLALANALNLESRDH